MSPYNNPSYNANFLRQFNFHAPAMYLNDDIMNKIQKISFPFTGVRPSFNKKTSTGRSHNGTPAYGQYVLH